LFFFVDRGITPPVKKLKEEDSEQQPEQGAFKGFIQHDNSMKSLL
jgi:hypothetical protein